ncbi:hypothetical protein C8J57DRAFT_1579957 [Mycena rebaudengoi]|nr:hypothetical protein C8J57DRAFT_1579957 [Mycena rebaudengoi]
MHSTSRTRTRTRFRNRQSTASTIPSRMSPRHSNVMAERYPLSEAYGFTGTKTQRYAAVQREINARLLALSPEPRGHDLTIPKLNTGANTEKWTGSWGQICSEEHPGGELCTKRFHLVAPPLTRQQLQSPELLQLFEIRKEVQRSLGATTVVRREPRGNYPPEIPDVDCQQTEPESATTARREPTRGPLEVTLETEAEPAPFQPSIDLNCPLHIVAWVTDTEDPVRFTFYPSIQESHKRTFRFIDYHATLFHAGIDEGIEVYLHSYGMWIPWLGTAYLPLVGAEQFVIIRAKGVISFNGWPAVVASLGRN